MRIAVFGATGATGQLLTAEALARGHQVTALARDPDKLDAPQARIVRGDARDAEAVQKVVRDAEAVICCLGAPPKDTTGIRAAGTEAIVRAMNQEGVDRLVAMSSYGVAETYDNLPFFIKRVIVPLILRKAFDDHEAQERIIEESELAWTIVRPPNLVDGPPQGVQPLSKESGSMKITRADVANFMLDQLEDSAWVNKKAAISN